MSVKQQNLYSKSDLASLCRLFSINFCCHKYPVLLITRAENTQILNKFNLKLRQMIPFPMIVKLYFHYIYVSNLYID